MKELKVFFGLFLIFIIGSVASSCSKNDDEPKSSEVSLIGTWERSDSYDVEDCYPYFIVQEGFCYFCNTSSLSSWGEKYKYVYSDAKKTLICWEWNENRPNDGYGNDEADCVMTIVKLTSDELWLELAEYGETNGELIKFKRVK